MGEETRLPPDYTEPKTIEEAEQRRMELGTHITSIQAQLSSRNQTDKSGQRVSSFDYWTWRKNATCALTHKVHELRLVKTWITAHYRDSRSRVVAGVGNHEGIPIRNHAKKHLRDLCAYTESLEDRIAELVAENQTLTAMVMESQNATSPAVTANGDAWRDDTKP